MSRNRGVSSPLHLLRQVDGSCKSGSCTRDTRWEERPETVEVVGHSMLDSFASPLMVMPGSGPRIKPVPPSHTQSQAPYYFNLPTVVASLQPLAQVAGRQ